MTRKVLIVDDISMNRKVIKGVLNKRLRGEVELLEAEDGYEAIEIMNSQQISTVILDIMMPGIDGIEVLRFIKNDEKIKNVPVIICSAINELDSLEKALSLGALDYFTKPLTEEQMRITLPLKVNNALDFYDQNMTLLKFYNHISEEMQLAEGLQKQLIFENQSFKTAEAFGKYSPCEGIGGDMFCCKEKDKKLWFMIADISGHGIAAAMLSTMINVLFNISINTCKTPAEVLMNINKTIAEGFANTKHRIASAFVGCIIGEELHYANAGQPYPIIYRKNETKVENIEANGFLLGMLDDVTYDNEVVKIESGDAIVLYTDGIFDKGGAEGFAAWGLVREYCDNRKERLEGDLMEFLENMFEYFKNSGEGCFIDDVAVMAIRKK